MTLLLHIFEILVGIAIPLAAFVAGLRATQPLWLWHHRGLLWRSLFVILCVVPVVAIALVEWLAPDDLALRVGIAVTVLCIGIGPLDLMKDASSRDDAAAFEIGLDMVLLALAIVYIPLAVALHGLVFAHSFSISGWLIARVVLAQGLVPFLIGLGVARLWPRACRLAERYAERFINTVLLVVVLVALIVGFKGLVGVGARAWLTSLLIAAVALGIGHALGGPTPVTRTVLAITSAIRFPALALLIVSLVPNGARFIPPILVFVISSGVLSAIYRAAMTRRQRTAPSGPHAPLSAGAR